MDEFRLLFLYLLHLGDPRLHDLGERDQPCLDHAAWGSCFDLENLLLVSSDFGFLGTGRLVSCLDLEDLELVYSDLGYPDTGYLASCLDLENRSIECSDIVRLVHLAHLVDTGIGDPPKASWAAMERL